MGNAQTVRRSVPRPDVGGKRTKALPRPSAAPTVIPPRPSAAPTLAPPGTSPRASAPPPRVVTLHSVDFEIDVPPPAPVDADRARSSRYAPASEPRLPPTSGPRRWPPRLRHDELISTLFTEAHALHFQSDAIDAAIHCVTL